MQTSSLKILYEDENIIAVDKAEGISSIAENDLTTATIHSMLEAHLKQNVLIVHRIDKDVSGVILFAKGKNAHRQLNKQFFDRSVSKYYSALVIGEVNNLSGIINKPIKEFGSGRMGVDQKGKQSITNYRVVETFDGYSLLELNPSTGRRHQLRVHLYSLGNPIVGDTKYGDKNIQKNYKRLMLHASRIEFSLNNKRIRVESELPLSFIEVIEMLKVGNKE
jgi:RluA family pseudouridine synthase